MTDQKHESDAETGARLALATAQANQIITLDDGRTFAIVADGPGKSKIHNVTVNEDMPLPLPQRVSQKVEVTDAESLITYVNRFKNENSVLFADICENRIVAVIDYHKPGTETQPDLLAHNVTLNIPYSTEWITWTQRDGILRPQLDFVRFIEDNAPDVVSPSAADLIEVCRDMQALRRVNFTNVVRTASNNAEKFEYTNDTNVNVKGGVEIPTAFDLALPVYFNGAVKPLKARLRYELDDGTLKLGIKLLRAENLRQDTFKEIVEQVRSETGLVTIYGEPGEGWSGSYSGKPSASF